MNSPTDVASPRTAGSHSSRTAALGLWARRNIALILLVALALLGALFVEQFRSVDNLLQILKSQSFVGFVALGMTWVVLAGKFVDLSVPATIAVTANAALAWQSLGPGIAVLAALGTALAIGLVNGIVVSRLEVNPVIATLAVGSICAGLLLAVTGGALSRPIDDNLGEIVNGTALGLPVLAVVFLLLTIIFELVLRRTPFGLGVRLVGGNARMAASIGLRPSAVTIAVFAIMALMAGVTGCALGLFAGQADVALGAGYEFDALIAVVLGGTALAGGIGGFTRTFVGVILIGVLNNLLLLNAVPTSGQFLVKGIVFTTIVAVDSYIAVRRR